MVFEPHECPQCGAAVKENATQCEYCGTWLRQVDSAKPRMRKNGSRPYLPLKLPAGVGEFGTKNSILKAVGLLLALGLYVIGWTLEDTDYWLDARAMLVWVGLLPLWLLGVALMWRSDRMVLAYGLLLALGEFIAHVAVIFTIRGNLWDDHVGIAGLVAGASLAGWLLGRLLHGVLRWRRIRSR
jgi:hypothetical protein